MRAFHRYCGELRAAEGKGKEDELNSFAHLHRDLTVSTLRSKSDGAAQYLVTWHHDSRGEEWREYDPVPHWSDDRGLLARDILQFVIFAADGTALPSEFPYVIDGNIADLDGDGEPEVFVISEPSPGGTIPGLPSEPAASDGSLLLRSLEVRPVDPKAQASFVIVYNAHPKSAAPENVWDFRFRREGNEKSYDLQLGPATALGGIEPKVTLRWDRDSKRWKELEPGKGDHFRVIDPAKKDAELEAIAKRGGLGYLVTPALEGDLDAERMAHLGSEVEPDGLSKAYEPRNLAVLSAEELLRYFECAPLAYEFRSERFVAATSVPDFWKLPPKEAALRYVLRNRPASTWPNYLIGAFPKDGETPPESGDLRFTDGPGGCFAPGGGSIHHLHCDPEESYLLFAEHLDFWREMANAEESVHFEFRKVSLPYETARHVLQTVWWMSRVRSRNVSGEHWGGGGSGFSMGTGAASTVSISGENGQSSSVTDEPSLARGNEFRGVAEGTGEYAPSSYIALVTQMFSREIEELLGRTWTVQKFREGQRLTAAQTKELKGKAEEALKLFIAGKGDVEVAAVAALAAGMKSWKELQPLVSRAGQKLPPPVEHERRIAQIDGEIEEWRRKVGDHASLKAHYERQSRNYERERVLRGEDTGMLLPDPSPGVPGVLDPASVEPSRPAIPKPTLSAKQVEEEKADQRHAAIDALYNERSAASYKAPREDQAVAESRKTIALALKMLEVADDAERLLAWGAVDESAARFAIARLTKVDPGRALGLARSCEDRETHPMSRTSFRMARERLETDMKVRSAPALDEASALAILGDAGKSMSEREDALKFLVPEEEPKRFKSEKIDHLLSELLTRENAVDHQRPASLAILTARRAGGEAWAAILKYPEYGTMVGLVRISTVMPALVFIAEMEPQPYREKLRELIASELKTSRGYLNGSLAAAWISDLRVLEPELRRLATRGPEDFDSPRGFGGSNHAEAVVHRLHRARHLVALWNEKDPLTLARSLVAFAVANAEMFAEFEGTSHRRLAKEIGRAKAGLKEEGLSTVRGFIDWCETNAVGTLRRPAKPEEVEAVAKFLRESFAQ